MKINPANVYKFLYRKKLKDVLSGLNPLGQKKQSRSVYSQILKDAEFIRTQSVFIYSALPLEVQTSDLIAAILIMKKKLFLPRVEGAGTLAIFEVLNFKRDLVMGKFGILEPNPKRCRKANPNEVDLWILPGLAFDFQGGRLGRGAGYFDRFFEKVPKAKKWALSYHEQILPEVPCESHDVRIHRVIVGR